MPGAKLDDGSSNIHVHHICYDNIGNERFGDLVVICNGCHQLLHDRIDRMRKGGRRSRAFVMRRMLPVMRRRLVFIHESWRGES